MTVAEKLPAALRNRRTGKTEIEDVRVEIREDASEREALFITLVLSGPPSGADTWPIDDLWALRRMTREVVNELERELETGMPIRWAIEFEPEVPDEIDEDDASFQIDVDD
ncbi:MAG: hypothetical protein JSS97_01565 [Actinobacteria bacterium]|nr:hypothetical protein [Actinomycetota bacterium]